MTGLGWRCCHPSCLSCLLRKPTVKREPPIFWETVSFGKWGTLKIPWFINAFPILWLTQWVLHGYSYVIVISHLETLLFFGTQRTSDSLLTWVKLRAKIHQPTIDGWFGLGEPPKTFSAVCWMINRHIWVCLKMGYTPNYSHVVGIMIINHWVWHIFTNLHFLAVGE